MFTQKSTSQFVTDLLELFINIERPSLILYSGGSQLEALQNVLAELSKQKADLKNLVLAPIDERYAENPTHKDSNQQQLFEKLGEDKQKLEQKGLQFKSILQPEMSMEEVAADFDSYLGTQLSQGTQIISLLGLGEDLHIAGILPHHISAASNFYTGLVTSYNSEDISQASKQYKHRITCNFNVLVESEYIWVYVPGENKLEAVEELTAWNKRLDSWDFALKPGLFLHRLEKVTIYSDA